MHVVQSSNQEEEKQPAQSVRLREAHRHHWFVPQSSPTTAVYSYCSRAARRGRSEEADNSTRWLRAGAAGC